MKTICRTVVSNARTSACYNCLILDVITPKLLFDSHPHSGIVTTEKHSSSNALYTS